MLLTLGHSTNDDQIVQYAKLAAGAAASVDGTNVVGGTAAQIALADAAFVPAPAKAAGGAAGAAPPAAAAPAAPAAPAVSAPPAAVAPPAVVAPANPNAITVTIPQLGAGMIPIPGTTTTIVTVTPGALAAPTPAA